MSRVMDCASFGEMVVKLLNECKKSARFEPELFFDAANITYRDTIHAFGEMFFNEAQYRFIRTALGTLFPDEIKMLLLKV